MSLRITIPTIGLDNRGGTRIYIELANRFAQGGHVVKILVPRGSNKTTFYIHPNVIIQYFGFPIPQIEDISSLFRTVMLFIPILQSCDVLVANYYLTSFPVAFSKIINKTVRTIYLIQGYEPVIAGSLERTFPRLKKWLVEITYRFPMEQITVANWLAERLLKLSKRQAHVIHPNIDLSIFKPGNGKNSQYNPTILAFPSNDIYKGWKDFTNAVRILGYRYPNLGVMATSRFPYPLPPGSYVAKHPKNDYELVKLYQTASLYVHPSWCESWGLSPLEAMACGTPVVAAASEGILEYGVDGENCLLVPPQSPDMLADAICRIIDDKALSTRLIDGGFKTVKRFAWPRMADEFEAFLLSHYHNDAIA